MNVNASNGYAVGINASTGLGYAEVVNLGDITVYGYSSATGIHASAKYDVSVINGGDLSVSSYTETIRCSGPILSSAIVLYLISTAT